MLGRINATLTGPLILGRLFGRPKLNRIKDDLAVGPTLY